MVHFLSEKGMCIGDKINQNLRMPYWIKSNTDFAKCFIRGLFDTDGCFYIDTHTRSYGKYYYGAIAIKNYIPDLLSDVVDILSPLGYHPTVSTKNTVNLRREIEVSRFFKKLVQKTQEIY
jgi:intein/homing endonuclease